MKFNKNRLLEMELPYSALQDKIVGKNRWSDTHEIIFELDNKYYRTRYTSGSTEMQDEQPWEYQTEVDCEEVHEVEKIVKVWESINE